MVKTTVSAGTIKKPRSRFRRYCDLAVAMHVLQTKTLTLIDPERWDDGNDRYGMAAYKERKGLKSLLAMCFADSAETYHHWRVFTEGRSGVCIEIDRTALLRRIDSMPGFEHRPVDYRYLNILGGGPKWNISDLPFVKRAPYAPEKEYRLIYRSADEAIESISVPIELAWIKSVVLSPWMPVPLRDSVRATLRGIDGCRLLTVQNTSLISSDTWKSFIDRAEG